MTALDPLALPLTGRHLIEASAGTGKTHTICTLVLRLLLGHQDGTMGHAAHALEDILIMTFTRDATEELRGRIRQRLREARQAFAGDTPTQDPVLLRMLQDSDDRRRDHARLKRAELELDLASVVTIHGFARSVLARHAFESHAPFDVDISEDEPETVRDALRDFWRERVYPLSAEASGAALAPFGGRIERFIATAGRLLGQSDLEFVNAPAEPWTELCTAVDIAAAAVRVCWQRMDAAGRSALTELPLNQGGRTARAAVIELLKTGTSVPFDETALRGLDRAFLTSEIPARCKNVEVPELEIFALAAVLEQARASLGRALLRDALPTVRARLEREKARSGCLGYDDLLRLLESGLNGTDGTRLAAAIRRQFPVALIDEFQDTDPLQWRVFDAIYPSRAACTLFLVGDPKQAIYGFRGADVHAYLRASEQTASRVSMDTNYRSVQGLVKAVNALFSLRGDADPFAAAGRIPFRPVLASGRPEERALYRDGQPLAPLEALPVALGETLSITRYRAQIAAATADHLARLLGQAAAGRILLGDAQLRAGDIACLVRSRFEADLLEAELKRRNVPCIYRGRESVYASDEARDVYQLLNAVLHPASERALRTALAGALLGFSAGELNTLFSDEQAFARAQARFIETADALQWLGPQAALRRLLFHYAVPARLLSRSGGERQLTNCLHLLELLQRERQLLDSDEALLSSLAARMANADGEKEEQQLRLESDALKVRIVTIHAAKGLQYPVVYLPFAAAFRAAGEPLYHDSDAARTCWDLACGAASMQRADRERLAEDMRLLYVALTRAVHLCVVGVADTGARARGSEFAHSALGHLLAADSGGTNAAIARLLEISGAPRDDESAAGGLPADSAAAGGVLQARRFRGRIETHWRQTSFSALTRPLHVAGENVFRQPELAADRLVPSAESVPGIIGFPRGPRHGTFLHSVLEHADFAAGARSTAARAALARELDQNGYEDKWLPVLSTMLDDVLGCALDAHGLSLETLSPGAHVAEMRFALPLAEVDASRLNAIVDPLAAMPPLRFATLKGMLTGAMDLVFESAQRFYVADFKSNLLGTTLAHYAPEQLDAAMCEHRYDLQYLFYTVALQRYLRVRLGSAFDYDAHIGGVYYLYLRGMRRGEGNRYGVWYRKPPRAQIAALDALFAGTDG